MSEDLTKHPCYDPKSGVLKGYMCPLCAKIYPTEEQAVLCKGRRHSDMELAIAKLKPEKLRFLALCIDTEGTICLHKGHYQNRYGHYFCLSPQIGISNTSKIFIAELEKLFPRKAYISSRQTAKSKEAYTFMITGLHECLLFLEKIEPYLIIKKQQAKTLMAYCRSRLSHEKVNEPYSPFELQCFEEMKKLNKRGA